MGRSSWVGRGGRARSGGDGSGGGDGEGDDDEGGVENGTSTTTLERMLALSGPLPPLARRGPSSPSRQGRNLAQPLLSIKRGAIRSAPMKVVLFASCLTLAALPMCKPDTAKTAAEASAANPASPAEVRAQFDILRDSAVENRAPTKGMGIEARSAAPGLAIEVKGVGGVVRSVVLESVKSVRTKVGSDGRRIKSSV